MISCLAELEKCSLSSYKKYKSHIPPEKCGQSNFTVILEYIFGFDQAIFTLKAYDVSCIFVLEQEIQRGIW